MNLSIGEQFANQLLDVATDIRVSMEQRLQARATLRRNGYGEVLSERMKQHTQAMKDKMREQLGDEKYAAVEQAVEQTIRDCREGALLDGRAT